MTIVDTDLLIAHLRGKQEAKVAFKAIEAPKASSISRWELYRGIVGRSDERSLFDRTERFLQRLEVLPLDALTCLHAARIFEGLRDDGLDVGVADAIVAGTALRQRETLVSRNEKHFKRVEGLRFRTW